MESDCVIKTAELLSLLSNVLFYSSSRKSTCSLKDNIGSNNRISELEKQSTIPKLLDTVIQTGEKDV